MQKILIVEDDLKQLDLLERVLTSNYPSWIIDCANSFKTALKLIDESCEKQALYSLFLFDVKLALEDANADGFELGRYIRLIEDYYCTPVLYLTSVFDANLEVLHDVHYYDYIMKPYTSNDILNRIQNMLIKNILSKDTFLVTDIHAVNHKISANDILFAHSSAHILYITTTNYIISTRKMSIHTLLKYTTPHCVRCHSRYVVNKNHINNFDSVTKTINIGNHSLPVSKAYLSEIKDTLQKGLEK